MNRLIFHCGVNKTASSTLQQTVWAGHSQIHYLGKSVKNKVEKGCRTQRTYDILAPLLWNEQDTLPGEDAAEALRAEVLAEVPRDKVAVMSWEALGAINHGRFCRLLERMEAAVPGFKLLMVLRNPLTWVSSLYLQEVQGHFRKCNRESTFGKRPYLPLEAWLQRKMAAEGEDGLWVSFPANARHAVERLGRERVGIFVFEQLKQDAAAYYSEIARFCGIGEAEAVELALGQMRNPRLLQSELEYIQSVDRFWWRRRRWYRTETRERRRQVDVLIAADEAQAPARAELSEAYKRLVASAVRDDCAWLERELGLGLADYDYPL